MGIARDEFKRHAKDLDEAHRKEFAELKAMDADLLDVDGYPTEHCVKLIEKWHWSDVDGWFEFLEQIWAFRDYGWHKTVGGQDEWLGKDLDPRIIRYHVSTMGWSGNETAIRAMKQNEIMWNCHWVQSRRGGHYIFEVKPWLE